MASRSFTGSHPGMVAVDSDEIDAESSSKVQQIYDKLPGSTISTAESCTGGMISHWLTDPPGSSRFFVGGICAYSNRIKSSVLGVSDEVIAVNGAVSAEVVEAMAIGARKLMASDWAVSVSGIAGPAGGTPEKPIGTVWCGIAGPAGVYSRLLRLSGDRRAIREMAALGALDFLLETIDAA